MAVSNPFLPLAQDEGSDQGRFHTLNVTGNNASVAVSNGVATVAVTGGSTSLGIYDFWHEAWLALPSINAGSLFQGFAVASGVNSGAITTGMVNGYTNAGVLMRCSSSNNSGYRYSVGGGLDYFGVISHKFQCLYQPRNSFGFVTTRIGYHDTITQADATDGAYFEIDTSGVCTGKTASNGSRTPTASTYSLTINTPYLFDIEVNAAATTARFRIFAGASTTPVFDQTVVATIPTTSARAFSCGFIATCTIGAATDLGVLYFLGLGTVEGFTRARGAQ